MFNRYFMFGFLVLILVIIGFYTRDYIRKTSTAKALKEGFIKIEKLKVRIEDDRNRGIRLNSKDLDLQEFKPAFAEELRINEQGTIQIKFHNSVTELGGRWIFIVPAVRGQGMAFNYLDKSNPRYDMVLPLTWICGVIQYDMPNRDYLPENCQYILGPEYTNPF